MGSECRGWSLQLVISYDVDQCTARDIAPGSPSLTVHILSACCRRQGPAQPGYPSTPSRGQQLSSFHGHSAAQNMSARNGIHIGRNWYGPSVISSLNKGKLETRMEYRTKIYIPLQSTSTAADTRTFVVDAELLVGMASRLPMHLKTSFNANN